MHLYGCEFVLQQSTLGWRLLSCLQLTISISDRKADNNAHSWNFAGNIWFDFINLSTTWNLDLHGFIRFPGMAFVLVADFSHGKRGRALISTNAVGDAEVGSTLCSPRSRNPSFRSNRMFGKMKE